jgi:peroxiredoxin
VTNLKDKPFALVGVNVSGHEPKKLKEVMEKARLTWRSFADPGVLGSGAIATRWSASTTPTLYLLDHRGVIRRKWVGNPGENAIDAAIAKLIDEAKE